VIHFTFGRNDKTRSWLHEKLMTIKLTTCSLLQTGREMFKEKNYSQVLFFVANKQLERKIAMANVLF
jgi:hypothetical protein